MGICQETQTLTSCKAELSDELEIPPLRVPFFHRRPLVSLPCTARSVLISILKLHEASTGLAMAGDEYEGIAWGCMRVYTSHFSHRAHLQGTKQTSMIRQNGFSDMIPLYGSHSSLAKI